MSEIKLLPCPFCGGEANGYNSKEVKNRKFSCLVRCEQCGASMPGTEILEVINAWNTRKPVEDVLERLEELMEKAMRNSEKAAELGKAYEKHMIFNGAKGTAFEEGIEIVKECMTL